MNRLVTEQSFRQRVVEAASIRPDKVAMMVINGKEPETITFGSMLAQMRSIAYRLTQEDIAFGDRVAIIGENHPNYAWVYGSVADKVLRGSDRPILLVRAFPSIAAA